MIEKYLQVCGLLEQVGTGESHLDQIQKIVQKPDFQYDVLSCPNFLTNLFLACSYWLDKELFDERCLYERCHKVASPHLKMLDIGATLIDKGFPLEYHPQKYEQNGPKHLAPYVKTFVEQCHKRHAFLCGLKTNQLASIQKVRN